MGRHFGHPGRGADWKFGASDGSLLDDASPGRSGEARLHAHAGNGRLSAASTDADDSWRDDVFVYHAGDGDASFNGGAGEDTVRLVG